MVQDGSDGQVTQQAARSCALAAKYHLQQQVGFHTRGKEILDLVWSSNPDTFPYISDHGVVTVITFNRLTEGPAKEENFLL